MLNLSNLIRSLSLRNMSQKLLAENPSLIAQAILNVRRDYVSGASLF